MPYKNDKIAKIDNHIGGKVHALRLAKGLSRSQLSSLIGVTHQQVYKYEKGIDRISIGRLSLISDALETTLAYFYEEVGSKVPTVITQHQRMCLEVSRNFMKIKNPRHQEAINTFIKHLMKESK